jgi:hypothetical protein
MMPGLSRSIAIVAVAAAAIGCVRTVQAWPPPLVPGTAVRVRFAAPRTVVFDRGTARDSVPGVQDLRGDVLSIRGDTLVLRVSGDPNGTTGESTLERQTTIALNQSMTVTSSQIDGWKFAYALLSGVVLVFAGLVMASD